MSDLTDAVAVADDDEWIEPGTLAKLAVPVLTIGAAFVIRKAMDAAYEKATGHHPPRPTDPDASLRRVIVYAAATAAAVAVANVVIGRLGTPRKRTHV